MAITTSLIIGKSGTIGEDGRVRNSTKRGLRDVFRTCDVLEYPMTVETAMNELNEMAREYSGKRHDHLLKAKEDARF